MCTIVKVMLSQRFKYSYNIILTLSHQGLIIYRPIVLQHRISKVLTTACSCKRKLATTDIINHVKYIHNSNHVPTMVTLSE